MKVYLVKFYDGNTMCGEMDIYLHSTQKGAIKRMAGIIHENLDQVRDPAVQGEIAGALENGDIELAYSMFSQDGGTTGMMQIEIEKVSVGK